MPIKIDTENRIARSQANRTAGRILKRARELTETSQGEFAIALAKRLGLAALSQSAISDWELGNRQVPAAAVLEAARVARVEPAELLNTESVRQAKVKRLEADLEAILGVLTPDQKRRVRAVETGDGK